MQVVSHSLAHRAPPATRTRVRWQPYNAIQTPAASTSHAPSRSPSLSYLHTPASNTLTPAQTPLCETDRLRQALPPSRDPSPSSKDVPKSKNASGLVDQTVKTLCDIWHPYDIPAVFLISSRAAVTVGCPPDASFIMNPSSSTHGARRHSVSSMHSNVQQLPSPISPSSNHSPSLPHPSSTPSQPNSSFVHDLASLQASRSNLVPMKGFVHEVLRRSRTSGGVLQTALCYLEALRSKVPELVKLEKEGKGIQGEPDLESRITKGSDDIGTECDSSTPSTGMDEESTATMTQHEELVATVKVMDDEELPADSTTSTPTATSSCSSNTSSTDLPSPLLCPRRAFLAALILASKFTQDKCYSNRAWAKLSGLPAREIGRCERALGAALDWRLWVGKRPVGRTVGRSRSEASILPETKARSSRPISFAPLAPLALPSTSSSSSLTVNASSKQSGRDRLFRRCSTLPSECFATPATAVTTAFNRSDLPLIATAAAPFALSPSKESSPFVAFRPPLHPTPSLHASDFMSRCSPPSPVPSLSHSPSSTESSSGDRTIQMSSFLDDSLGLGSTFSYGSFDCDRKPEAAFPSHRIHSLKPQHVSSFASTRNSNHNAFSYAGNRSMHHQRSPGIAPGPLDPKAMMDGITGTGNAIPEPMVGVVHQEGPTADGVAAGSGGLYAGSGGGGGPMGWGSFGCAYQDVDAMGGVYATAAAAQDVGEIGGRMDMLVY